MDKTLKIPATLFKKMQIHFENCLPEEGCGLLAGEKNQALQWFPITNIFHSAVRYRMDAQEQLNAFHEIEKKDWQLLAIVHSHPTGPAYPSITDIAEAYYPDVVYIIYTIQNHNWLASGFLIQNETVKSIKIIKTK